MDETPVTLDWGEETPTKRSWTVYALLGLAAIFGALTVFAAWTSVGILTHANATRMEQASAASGLGASAAGFLLVLATVLLVMRTRELRDATHELADSTRATEALTRKVVEAERTSFLLGDHEVTHFAPDFLRLKVRVENRGRLDGAVAKSWLTPDERGESGRAIEPEILQRMGSRDEAANRRVESGDAVLFDMAFRNPARDWEEGDRWVLHVRPVLGDDAGKWIDLAKDD